jgi:hypothetical protein
MRIYAIHFKKYEGGYNEPSYVERKKDHGVEKLKADKESGLLVPEHDILKYVDFGGGYTKIIFISEMSDSYFNPIISESEIVENKIKSRKTGEVIGQQS